MLDIDDIKKRRYVETVQEIDAFGRAIMVGRLKPSQQARASEMTLNGGVAQTIGVVCAVREVDGNQYAFPRNRAEVDARMDMLQDEGIEAAVKAYVRLYDDKPLNEDGEKPTTLEAAKNS